MFPSHAPPAGACGWGRCHCWQLMAGDGTGLCRCWQLMAGAAHAPQCSCCRELVNVSLQL